MAGQLQLIKSAVIIEVPSVKILRARQVGFTRIRTASGTLLEWLLPLMPGALRYDRSRTNTAGREPRRAGRYAGKRRITCHSLIQKISSLQQIRSHRTPERGRQKKVFCATIEVEGG